MSTVSPAELQVRLEQAVAEGRLVAQATLVRGPGRPGSRMLIWPSGERTGSLGHVELDRQVTADALEMMARPRAESRHYPEADARVFVEIFAPPPHLVIFGGVHIAIPPHHLCQSSRLPGHHCRPSQKVRQPRAFSPRRRDHP
ncbi:MAG: XdhC family protein [Ardenticatenia bacterium]|nr:XdhC family protein [Ardenticatenia bacterium]